MAADRTPSLVGRQVSHYKIIEKIGSGGMGEVYRAHDSRLGRDVALKFSADRFSERFEREARMVAALNHTNICTLHDVGPNYLVMELVEGPTLAERIQEGPIPQQEALQIAKQMADALEAAHEKGIIHRDLKPGNVKIKPDGTVKVLDFGLATVDPVLTGTAADESPTLGAAKTQSGMIVGTVAYMSPEQAGSRPVDKRSDVWSFGVALWEMLTGTRLFQGESVAHTLADVLRAEIDFNKLPEETPAPIRDLLVRCLDRDTRSRLRDLGEARVVLSRYLSDSARISGTGVPAQPSSETVARVSRPRARIWVAAGTLVAVGVAVAASMLLYFNRAKPVPGPEQWRQITNFPDSATDPALSPDGRMLAFTRGGGGWFLEKDKQVYVKILPDSPAVQLTHDQLAKMSPVFSPDGSRIAYTVGGFDTWVVPVLAGGEPQLMLPKAEGLTWIDSQRVLFSEIKPSVEMGLETAMENRISQREIYMPEPIGMAHFSSLSPDRKQVLVVEMSGGTRPPGPWLPCRLLPFDGSSRGRQVGPAPAPCTAAAWTPDGKWMYFTADVGKGSHIWRQRVNGGQPEQVTFGPGEQQGLAMAPDGRSLFTSVGTRHNVLRVHDANGDRQISGEGNCDCPPIFSRDGTSVYYRLQTSADAFVVWVTDLKTGQAKPAFSGVPMTRWDVSGDGKSILYTMLDKSSWIAALDRQSPPFRLPIQDQRVEVAASGEMYFETVEDGRHYLYAMRLDGSSRHKVFPDPVNLPVISPDERWVLSQSATGSWEVRPISGGRPRVACALQQPGNTQIFPACFFRWSQDGKTALFIFRALAGGAGTTVAVPLEPGTALPPLPPGGVRNMDDVTRLPGAFVIPSEAVDVGPGMSYAYIRQGDQQNIFQIPLP
jgi:Tol biopolymer transport system component